MKALVFQALITVFFIGAVLFFPFMGSAADVAQAISLNGKWLFRKDPQNVGVQEKWWAQGDVADERWIPATVPSAWELFAGEDFDGIGWYRKLFRIPEEWQGKRIWLEFDSVSTVATAYVNGQEVGSHTGDYVRFRFEVTDAVRFGAENILTVRVDESVGHVTQGFLSVISLHHGGIWQGVRLYATGELAIKVNGVFADADPESGRVSVTVAFDGKTQGRRFAYELWITPANERRKVATAVGFADTEASEFSRELRVPSPVCWTPKNPRLYLLHTRLLTPKGEVSDESVVKFGFRKVETENEFLLLNGKPITFRAVLDWGYYKDKVAPAPDEATIRRQFADIKRLGFNGVKLVLVIMNPEYYDIADEMGILLWQEYPLWHMPIDKTTRDELMRMFEAFYRQDRNHPSIILRSITCESGGVDQEVMGELYGLGKRLIPNCLLEDNSSWFWLSNPEYADFWDEHPYLTNPQWVRYIESLDAVMAEKEAKPFLLGEAIAFNTWIDSEALLAKVGDLRPWWLPKVFESALKLEQDLKKDYGENAVRILLADSMKYALLHRKFQIELFRTRKGNTGYVVNVIRDIPLIRAGIYDDLERLRWSSQDFSFQGDISLILKTPDWQKGFFSSEDLTLTFILSNFSEADIENPYFRWGIVQPPGFPRMKSCFEAHEAEKFPKLIPRGEVVEVLHYKLRIDADDAPTPLDVNFQFKEKKPNRWRLWFFVKPAWEKLQGVYVHTPGYADITKYMPGAPIWNETKSPIPEDTRLIFSDVLTRKILDFVRRGGRAIILASNWPGAFGAVEHSYWRDVPFIPRTIWTEPEAQAILELQPYDLVRNYSMVVPTGEQGIADKVQPLLRLLDTHDLSEVAIYDQLFETRIGNGTLLVASLDFSTPAGQWLLRRLVDRLLTTDPPKTKFLTNEEAEAFSVPTPYSLIPLMGNWKFALDPKEEGVAKGWQLREFDDSNWRDLPVGRHWESFGINYDGWAWYRRWVDIPAEMAGNEVELVAEGIDDVYEVYINGKFVKFHGDIKLGHPEGSVWLKRTVTEVGDFLKPGEANLIAIRVLDWTGAGGIWKPIYLAVAKQKDKA